MLRLIAALCLFSTAALAHDYEKGDLHADHPWARPSVTANGAVYLVVHNRGSETDRLTGATSDIAERVMLHTTERDGNIMRMRHVDGIDVPANGLVALAPGGYHIMLLGLTQELTVGETFPLTLSFEKAGDMPVEIKVEPLSFQQDQAHDAELEDHGGHH